MTPPNALAFNVLDTAQLDPGYVLDLANALDIAQVTIVQATHPAEAFALAQRFRKERPNTDVFYRKWKQDLPDENMVNQTRPDEWLNYFRDVLDIGCYGCIYNESLTAPIKKQNDYSIEVLNLTVPKGYRTVHFKVSTGNPGGYNKEYLLPTTDPHYRPDEYAQSDALWIAISQANKSPIDKGDYPLAWVAPHMYFNQFGAATGMTDRWKEIIRRLDDLLIEDRYVPLAAGEFGMAYRRADGSIDSGKGYSGIIAQSLYAELFASVYKSDLKPGNIIPHLFSLGDQQRANNEPGQWYFFDTYKANLFWERMKEIAGTGTFRLSSWYSQSSTTPPPPPVVTPPYTPDPFTSGMRYQVTVPADFINVRAAPSTIAAKLGEVPNKAVVTVFEETLVSGEYWRRISFGTISGWVSLQKGAVKFAPYLPDNPSMVSIPIDLLKDIASSLKNDADETRRLSVQMAAISDDLMKDYSLVKAILDKIGTGA